jgi:hypothetical protein
VAFGIEVRFVNMAPIFREMKWRLIARDRGTQGYGASLRAPAQTGAPRPMKMGTIVSLWCYDSIAGDTLQSASLGCSAIQRYASWILDVGWFG